MQRISLIVLLAAVGLVSGCHTRGYTRAMNYRLGLAAQDTNSNQPAHSNTNANSNTTQVANQANK